MEEVIFPQSSVQKQLKHFVLVKLYTDDHRSAERELRNDKNRKILQDRYNVAALPFYAIVTPKGEDVATFPGMTRDANEFAEFLKNSVAEAQRSAPASR